MSSKIEELRPEHSEIMWSSISGRQPNDSLQLIVPKSVYTLCHLLTAIDELFAIMVEDE